MCAYYSALRELCKYLWHRICTVCAARMSERFGNWLTAVLETTPDLATGEPRMEQVRLAKLLHMSPEKINSWCAGRREPSTPEDVNALARVLNRPASQILEQRGFDVGVTGLTEAQREMLAAFDQIPDSRRDLQEAASALVLQLARSLAGQSANSQPPRRRRSAE